MRRSDASVICRITYFQFPIQSAFLPCRKPGSCSGVSGLPNRTSDVAENVESTLLVRSVHTRGETELILTEKMETRHPVEGHFSSEFPAICNHFGVMTI